MANDDPGKPTGENAIRDWHADDDVQADPTREDPSTARVVRNPRDGSHWLVYPSGRREPCAVVKRGRKLRDHGRRSYVANGVDDDGNLLD